ncbi:TfoX N-terminal domain-containing protein [Quadrisphaera granulorum]|uniref:TfoX-like protein n=1 Tax=Quadrisphaera granulorum TaxID=317664 RepID=A0A315ZPT2_9ACTN|nr:TfoX/Sxy family protein [Quadrisphaera granulorum]PWJ46898.1 TfoX-like protein [Quadrisphaera granulorum]SZE98990.1 TfoX N-terminal domain-containing protein [Quadrisphaera granulorum]
MTAQQDLLERVRHALRDRSPREVSMFGGMSFMVEGRMVAAARREGALLLRIDPSTAAELLARPGAHPALMGADRPMGDGWISVDPSALEGSGLDTWLAPALSFHAAQGTT